jgi:hypothetical protein
MANRKNAKAEQALQSPDPWVTKTQLCRQHRATKAEVEALIKLDYLFPISLGPRMERFWREDAETGIKAYKAGNPAPQQTKFVRSSIDWEA